MTREKQRIHRRWLRLLPLIGPGLALLLALTNLPAPARATTSPPSAGWENEMPPARPVAGPDDVAPIGPSDLITSYVFLLLITRPETCQPIPGESYGDLSVAPRPPADPPAELHPDQNLALRSYELTDAYKGLVDYNGAGDPKAPQLSRLFAVEHTPVFNQVYRVYDWDWSCNCRGDLIAAWPVTLAGLAATPGETIHVPDSGYTLGDGYEVVVLYASTERITLKYTREDSAASGYTLHVENVCVEPNLLALYQTWNGAGRGHLPALRPGQAFGRARGSEISAAIRDNGSFLDPRSRKDWWQAW